MWRVYHKEKSVSIGLTYILQYFKIELMMYMTHKMGRFEHVNRVYPNDICVSDTTNTGPDRRKYKRAAEVYNFGVKLRCLRRVCHCAFL